MKIYYHTGVSGRIRFVTLKKEKNRSWTSDGYNPDTVDLKPVEELIDREVELNGVRGRIKEICSTNQEFEAGKYIGDGKYLRKSSQFHHLVGVFWETGILPYWVECYRLKFC